MIANVKNRTVLYTNCNNTPAYSNINIHVIIKNIIKKHKHISPTYMCAVMTSTSDFLCNY